jgi:hypothetical protein
MQGELENDELVMMLVESALERPQAERDSFLQSLCSDKPGLYQEIRSRIDWEELMGGFLREPLIVRDSPSGPFSAGDLVSGRFRILRLLGKGGMGVVYEVLDEKLDRRIAIKCAQVGFQNRLPPEARSAREVSHYNVCKVHELHTARTPNGEVDFLTMEFIDGETLAQRIARSGPLNFRQAREIAIQLCAGLAQAHRQGVVHGDLKCSNVILARSTDGGVRAVLTDFGLAKLKSGDGSVFGSGERGGTQSYMAPELFFGEPLSAASDIYALGIIFHVVLTGRAPARLRSPESIRTPGAASAADPDGTEAMTVTIPTVKEEDWHRKIADLPAPWRAIVDRCLAAEPTARFRSATEVTQALNPKRRTAKWIFAAVLTAIPIAGFTVWQWPHDAGPAVRLAMLPPVVEGAQIQIANGILDDVASRLAAVRGNFILISSAEVQRNKVDTPAKAKEVLGATHVMRTSPVRCSPP